MQGYLQFQNEIKGFEDVRDTAKTIEKIAASNVHRLRGQVQGMNAYTAQIETVLGRLSQAFTPSEHPLFQQHKGKRALLIVGSNKGLTGGLYHSLINAYLDKKDSYQTTIAIGTKIERYLKEEEAPVLHAFTDISEIPNSEELSAITDKLFEYFHGNEVGSIDIMYPKFLTLANHEPTIVPYLPFSTSLERQTESADKTKNADTEQMAWPIIEPGESETFNWYLQQFIALYFYKTIMEAKLSEFSARTVAMEHASQKSDDLVKDLRLSYVKERRKSITQKQLESFAVHRLI